MLSDDAREMIELQGRRRDLREALKDVEAEIAVVEQRLLDEFSRSGLQKLTMDGHTLYLHRQAWARPRDGETLRAIDALVQAGVLVEITGKKRDRVYAYQAYLDRLQEGTELGGRA